MYWARTWSLTQCDALFDVGTTGKNAGFMALGRPSETTVLSRGICVWAMGWWANPGCSAPTSVLLVKEPLPSGCYVKNRGENVSRPPCKCSFSSAHNMPHLVQTARRCIDIWGDPLPASYPREPNSEALASLASAQWNPCSHAYFGCINMFVISPWKRFLTPTLQVCDLWFCLPPASVSPLPGGRAGSMTQLREIIQNVAVQWRFKRVSLCAIPMLDATYDSLHLKQWSRFEH